MDMHYMCLKGNVKTYTIGMNVEAKWEVFGLGLDGNPLMHDIKKVYNEKNGTYKLVQYLQDHLPCESISARTQQRRVTVVQYESAMCQCAMM